MRDPLERGILQLAGLTLLGIVMIGLVTLYWGFGRADELAARSDNTRRISFDRRIARGRILDRAGRLLAETQRDANGSLDDPRLAEAGARRYPYPEAASVVGFQTWRYGAGGETRVAYGIGGAEAAYDRALRGDLGLSMRQLIASRVLHRAQVGHDVQLTLDAELQRAAALALAGKQGAVVILDVEDGAVRALLSWPSFDPSRLDDPTLEAGAAGSLFNRATQGLYPPGSTWKAVTLAAALSEDLVGLNQMVEDGQAEDYFEGFRVACDNAPEGAGRFDLAHAFGWSCNLTFARLGQRLGASRFRDYAARFGSGQAPPFSLPTVAGSVSADAEMPTPELVSAAFGQGELLVSPLQMALVAAALAGDGRLPVPYLLLDVPGVRWRSMADERGDWLTAVRPGVAKDLRRAMRVSGEEGWAASASRAAGFSVGGKTGTAQLGGDQAPHSWFIGHAPADAPRVAIAVLVENGGQGGEVAAPIAGRLLAKALTAED